MYKSPKLVRPRPVHGRQSLQPLRWVHAAMLGAPCARGRSEGTTFNIYNSISSILFTFLGLSRYDDKRLHAVAGIYLI